MNVEISKTRRVHKSEDHDTYIGRGPNGNHILNSSINELGWLGNPYTVEQYGREKCIELFKNDLDSLCEYYPVLRAKLLDMYGERLGCWCQDGESCHGDVLVSKINELYWESL